jgi:DNA ligase-1
VPVTARSCKHLKSLLGEKYEAARVKLKNPDGPSVQGKAASKTKAKKRKKGNDEEEDEDEDEDDDQKGDAAPELLLANKWDLEKGADPTGWWISEKLDGVRYVSAT